MTTDPKPRGAWDVAADVGRVHTVGGMGHAVSVLTAWRREIVEEIAEDLASCGWHAQARHIRSRFGGGQTTGPGQGPNGDE